MTIYDRYHNDPSFKVLVDLLRSQIYNAKYTPTEIREAALLAQIMFESEKMPSYIIEEKIKLIDSIRNNG